jgi:hypothetical protein
MSTQLPEPWMRGPVEGVPPLLQPVAHSLVYVREELQRVLPPLSVDQVWACPAGVGSIGFHVRHIAGSIDRLFTYARGEALSAEQLAALKSEREPGTPPPDVPALLALADAALDRAMAQVRATDQSTLADRRVVGRLRLESTVIGLLFHGAEHAQRHVGQIVTTARVVAGRE